MLGLTWEECCKERAGIGRSTADQIIQNLEEFGQDFFSMAQVTGITAHEFRRIRASINNHALLHGGEAIPIEVENAPRLIAALDAIRREAAVAPAPPDRATEASRCFAKAERALSTAFAELGKLGVMRLDTNGHARLQAAISEAVGKLSLLDQQVNA